MTRKIGLVLVAAALLLSSTPALAADGDGKVSGRLVDVRPDGKLVIEEQGPWKGPGTGIVTRTVDITPNTNSAQPRRMPMNTGSASGPR